MSRVRDMLCVNSEAFLGMYYQKILVAAFAEADLYAVQRVEVHLDSIFLSYS
jgi:hypothetical protein